MAPISKCRIAVIGAGLGGLTCARALQGAGADVTVFDKGRFAGGRLASREREGGQFDYGAQYFTVRGEDFRQVVNEWEASGVVAPWPGNFGIVRDGIIEASPPERVRYVGRPYMSSVARHLSRDLPLLSLHRITQLTFDQALRTFRLSGGIIQNASESGHDTEQFYRSGYDFVVLNMPPAQILELFLLLDDDCLRDAIGSSDAFKALQTVRLAPCFVSMLQFAAPVDTRFDGLSVKGGALSWLARDSSKPGRHLVESWILHASAPWSKAHLEADFEQVGPTLLAEMQKLLGDLPPVVYCKTQRWRYALAENPLADGFLFDAEAAIGYCGDWCQGNNIEAAFLSGRKLAERILDWHQLKTT
ncbi:MAG: NAD(P)-binding protein [Cyanobacteria bacterium REEB67]|nr:NAD(P)-binding protein [Cyanobacteria bacterium REEB67]